ncbi:MAG: hypothetical protein AB7L09_24530 [Nitrospira sp.]
MNWHFDQIDFKVAVGVGISLGLAEVVIQNAGWQPAHDGLMTIVVGAVAGAGYSHLIRWYGQLHELRESGKHLKEEVVAAGERSKQEIINAGERSKRELLRASKIPKEIVGDSEVATNFREIIDDYAQIQRKPWPPFTEAFLAKELTRFRQTTSLPLTSGLIECDQAFGKTYSPSFFSIWGGHCFVTHYGDWDYWTSIDGRRQLEANRQAIGTDEKKKKDVVRYFILPRCQDLPSEDIILDQIRARITLYVIDEEQVEKEFRCDVGVFFHGNEKDVAFYSKWKIKPENGAKIAELALAGKSLEEANNLYRHVTSRGKAIEITGRDAWKKFKTTVCWKAEM